MEKKIISYFEQSFIFVVLVKLGMEHGPCGDSHECEGGFQCKDKKENGYGTCK
jgi:hypothetical protein